jgi:hypothetical protein
VVVEAEVQPLTQELAVSEVEVTLEAELIMEILE